jgi:hypothetical protein
MTHLLLLYPEFYPTRTRTERQGSSQQRSYLSDHTRSRSLWFLPEPFTITCSICTKMKCCSQQCLKRDSSQHSMLCSTFRDFQQRPTAKHYRAIYFPTNQLRPHFIWFRTAGDRDFRTIVRADIDSVLPERSYGRLIVGSHHGLACRCTTEKVIEYHVDAQHKRIQPNLSLQLMITKSGVFRRVGGFVAQSSKYICYDNRPGHLLFGPFDCALEVARADRVRENI